MNWGDGSTTTLNDSPLTTKATHQYLTDGNYAVTATASSATRPNVSAGGLALDTSFDTDGKMAVDVTADADYGYAMAVQPDGKIVMGGWIGSDFGLIRLNPDGPRDMTFDDGAPAGDGLVRVDLGTSSDRAYAITLDPSPDPANPRIVIAGSSGGDFAVVRLNADGTLDTTFGDVIRGTTTRTGKKRVDFGGTDEAYALTIRPTNGKIVAAGYTTNGAPRYDSLGEPVPTRDFAVVRLTPEGDADASFDGDGRATVNFLDGSEDYAQAVAVQGDGGIVLGGYTDGGCTASGAVSSYDFALARLTDSGAIDPTFGWDGRALTDLPGDDNCATGAHADSDYSLLIQPADGKIIAAGVAERDTADSDFALVRYHPNGTVDTAFGHSGVVHTDFRSTTADGAYAAKLQPDGKIVAAGYSRGPSTTETRQDFAVVRYTADGLLDPTFGTGGKIWTDFGGTDSDDRIKAVDIDSTGRIVAAGHAGNSFAAARYLPGNTVAVTENGPPTPPGEVTAIAVSTGQVNVSWRDRTAHETGYHLERWFDHTGVWRTVAELPADVVAFSDTAVVASTNYRYRLVAYNGLGRSPSADASATTPDYAPGITLFPWSAFASSTAEQPIPEDLEDTTGTQLFQNGDNNPKALARVVLTKQPDAGLEYRLTRSSSDVNVWANPDRTGPILTQATGNEAAITFSGATRTVWVEREGSATGSAAAVLSLQSRQAMPEPPPWFSLDDAQIALTRRLIIGFGGHTQGANDLNLDNDDNTDGHVGMLDPLSGVAKMATQLRRQGFVVATFAEDPGNNSDLDTLFPQFCGDGVHARPGEPDDPTPHFHWGAYDLVMQMVNFWYLREIGIFGYSHGASSVRLLTHRLNDVWATLPEPKPVIQFTGYIDAVRLPRANEKFPGNDPPDAPGSKYLFDFWEYDEEEYRYPYRTQYHVNLFQRRQGPQNDDQKSGYDDLRGGELNRIHQGPFTQTEDPARMPWNIYEVNINSNDQTFPNDPFLSIPANLLFTGYHVPLIAIDHTSQDGLGGGKRDPDAGPTNKAIDAHPVVRNWLVWHITQGARWTVT